MTLLVLLTKIFLDFFLIYLNGVVLSRFLFLEARKDFFSTYFVLLLLGLFFFRFYAVFKKKSFQIKWPELNIDRKWFFLTLFFMGLGAYNSYQEFKNRDIWLDEYTQFKYGSPTNLKWSNVVKNAAFEQQPPIDYFLSSVSFNYFGWKAYAVRFHATLFFFLTLLLLSLFFFEHSRSYLFTAAGLGLFLTIPVVRNFSIDARPLSLALFFGLIFFFRLIKYFLDKEKKFDFHLLLSIFFFSLSVGFQPVLIIFFLTVVVCLMFLRNKPTALSFFGHNALAGILVAPIMLKVYLESAQLNQFVENFSFFDSVVRNFELKNFLNIYSLQFTRNKIEGFAGLGLILTLIVFILKKTKNQLHLALLVFALTFPVFFYPMFLGFINWGFYPKYYYCFTVLLMAIIFYVSWEMLEHIKLPRYGRAPLLLLFLLLPSYLLTDRQILLRFRQVHVYDKKLYQYLAQSRDLNVALNFNLANLGQWRGEQWIAHEIYAKEKLILVDTRKLGGLHNFYINWDLLPAGDVVNIHLIQKKYDLLYKIAFEELLKEIKQPYKLRQFGIHKVYSFRVPRIEVKAYWKSLLEKIKSKVPEEIHYLFLETELTESIDTKNLDRCLELFEAYKNFKGQAYMDSGAKVESKEIIRQNLSFYDCHKRITSSPIPVSYN